MKVKGKSILRWEDSEAHRSNARSNAKGENGGFGVAIHADGDDDDESH